MRNILKSIKKAQSKEEEEHQKIFYKSLSKLPQSDSNSKLPELQTNQSDRFPTQKIQMKKLMSQKKRSRDNYTIIQRSKLSLRNQISKQLLESLEKQHHNGKKAQIKQEEIPFYSQKAGFWQYITQEEKCVFQLKKSLTKLIIQLEDHQNFLKESQMQQAPIQLKASIYNTNESLLVLLQMELKKKQDRIERKKKKIAQKIQDQKLQYEEYRKLSKENQKLDVKLREGFEQLEKQENILFEFQTQLMIEQCEDCIIKQQLTQTFYNYGAKVDISEFKKEDVFRAQFVSWEGKVNNIQMVDIKIFLLTSLYPMFASIFNDFSYQSNIYKIMFGFDFKLSQNDFNVGLQILRSRIQKNSHDQGLNSLQDSLNTIVKSRKRKIVFICTEKNFFQRISQVQKDLSSFFNRLIKIKNIKFENIFIQNCEIWQLFFTIFIQIIFIELLQFFYFNFFELGKVPFLVQKQFEETIFDHYRLTIMYEYEKIGVQVFFDILFTVPEKINQESLKQLRKKVSIYDLVLCWFDIPKLATKQKMNEYREINNILSNCKSFSLSKKAQKSKK